MNSILGMKLGISTKAVHSRWPGSMLWSLPVGSGTRPVSKSAMSVTTSKALASIGLEPRVEDPAEGTLTRAESNHRRIQADGRLLIGRLPLVSNSRQSLERPCVGRSHNVQRRQLAPAEGIGHVLLGDHRLDRVDAQRPFGINILLKDLDCLVGWLWLEETDPFQ